jgi:hypothetical protein
MWLRAHLVKDKDGKAGRKTSTAKYFKSVLILVAHIPLIKPYVSCVIMLLPGTWITSRRHPKGSSKFQGFELMDRKIQGEGLG